MQEKTTSVDAKFEYIVAMAITDLQGERIGQMERRGGDEKAIRFMKLASLMAREIIGPVSSGYTMQAVRRSHDFRWYK
jgi:hypothetical protein